MIRENISSETKRVLELFRQNIKEKIKENYDFHIHEGELGFEVDTNEGSTFLVIARNDFTELEIYIHIKRKKVEGLIFNYEDGTEGYGNFEEGWHLTTHDIGFEYVLKERKIIHDIEKFVMKNIDGFLRDINYN